MGGGGGKRGRALSEGEATVRKGVAVPDISTSIDHLIIQGNTHISDHSKFQQHFSWRFFTHLHITTIMQGLQGSPSTISAFA